MFTRPLDVRRTEGFLSRHVVHYTVHRPFVSAFRSLHHYAAAPPSRQAASSATLTSVYPTTWLDKSRQGVYRH